MFNPTDITPLHRGAVRPHTGEQLSRMVGDPDAVFARLSSPPKSYRIGDEPSLGEARWLVLGAIMALALVVGVVVQIGGPL